MRCFKRLHGYNIYLERSYSRRLLKATHKYSHYSPGQRQQRDVRGDQATALVFRLAFGTRFLSVSPTRSPRSGFILCVQARQCWDPFCRARLTGYVDLLMLFSALAIIRRFKDYDKTCSMSIGSAVWICECNTRPPQN